MHATQGPLWTVLLQSNLEPEQWRLGKHTLPWAGANPLWPRCCKHSHTCQWYLFAVWGTQQTEQVSLNKWPPSPPCVRQKLDTEETCKQRKTNKQRRGNCSGSERCNRLKPCSEHRLTIGRGLWTLRRSINWKKERSETELTQHCPQQLQRNS